MSRSGRSMTTACGWIATIRRRRSTIECSHPLTLQMKHGNRKSYRGTDCWLSKSKECSVYNWSNYQIVNIFEEWVKIPLNTWKHWTDSWLSKSEEHSIYNLSRYQMLISCWWILMMNINDELFFSHYMKMKIMTSY